MDHRHHPRRRNKKTGRFVGRKYCAACGSRDWRHPKSGRARQCRPCSNRLGLAWLQRKKKADPAFRLWHNARGNAPQRGIPFSITVDDVRAVFEVRCPVFGNEWSMRRGPNLPTIDRIDSNRGYEPGNIAVISYRANTIKNDASITELEQVLAWLKRKGA